MLIKTERVYRRTEAGSRALESQESVPAWYRRMLGLMQTGATHSDVIRGGMCPHSSKQVFDWLDELETLGFAELVTFSTSSPGPDTTGSFSLMAELARQRAA